METEGTSDILYVGFNQDTSCFACGTENGFKIYNTDPYKNTFNREFDGGISVVTMLFRCNILALVCGGSKPKYSTDRVIMWDDDKGKCMGELKFKTTVKAVKMNKETIAVVLQDRIYVYEFKSLKIKEAIETYDNPNGLCCLSAKKDTNVLVCPDKEKGKIRIVINESFNTVEAHQGTIACLSISFDGSLVATASEKGTLVRIFNTSTGSKLQEVRRGADPAKIYSIAISGNDLLAVCSDKGNVHIYSINSSKDDTTENTTSYFGFMKSVLPTYFSSEWSFAQYKFCEDGKPMYTVCAFTTENSLILVSISGDYFKLNINKTDKLIECESHLKYYKE